MEPSCTVSVSLNLSDISTYQDRILDEDTPITVFTSDRSLALFTCSYLCFSDACLWCWSHFCGSSTSMVLWLLLEVAFFFFLFDEMWVWNVSNGHWTLVVYCEKRFGFCHARRDPILLTLPVHFINSSFPNQSHQQSLSNFFYLI